MEPVKNKIDSFKGNFTSPELTKKRPCPVCGSARRKSVLAIDDFQFFSDSAALPKRVDIRQCQCLDCFAVYMNPCYSAFGFATLFKEAGCSYGASAGRAEEEAAWLQERELFGTAKSILDIGCYDGSFLAGLPEGLVRTGIDIDASAIEAGKRKYGGRGINLIHGDFEAFDIADRPDVITAFHVLEHLPWPAAVLRRLRSISHGSTRLVIEVPVLENGATNDINGFLSVQHMTHFSVRSIRNIFASTGWEIIEESASPDYNGYRVMAVPSGERAVSGDPRDMRRLHDYLSSWHRSINAAGQRIDSFGTYPEYVIWGGGLHTEFLYHTTSFFHSDANRLCVIVDGDRIKHGKSWRGITIHGSEILKDFDWSSTGLLISSYGSQAKIVCAALRLGVPEENIKTIYDEIRVY